MASSTVALEAFSRATGITHVTMGHIARLLRQTNGDLWPRSGKGGGKSARHVEERHLSNLILAITTGQPSDATKTVTKLSAAMYSGEETTKRIDPSSILFKLSRFSLDELRDKGKAKYEMFLPDKLVCLIRRVAIAKASGRKSSKFLDEARRNWSLWIDLDANAAWTLAIDENNDEHVEYYAPDDYGSYHITKGDPFLMDRLVKIHFGLIEIAADLWTDTLAQRGLKPALVSASPAGGTAARKTESAGGGGTPPAPTRNRPSSRQSQADDQSSFRQTGGRTAPPKPKAGERETQARGSSATGRRLPKKGDRR